MANNAQSFLAMARQDIGYSRWTDPETGTKFGRFFRDVLGWGSYYGNNGVPYCGMAVSYWAYYAGVECPGLPGAYTPTMAAAGQKAGREVSKYAAQAGDVVYFDWEIDREIDHVGLVESNCGTYLATIEGNTNNGQVCRRTRNFDTIVCVIRPNFSGSSSSLQPSTPSTPSASKSDLVKQGQSYLAKWGYALGGSGVDGDFGPATKSAMTRYLQYNLGYYGQKVDVDGEYGPKTWAAYSKVGNVRKGCKNVYMNKAVQIALLCHGYSIGSSGIDGDIGNDSDQAIRSFQQAKSLSVDGDVGQNTMQALFG